MFLSACGYRRIYYIKKMYVNKGFLSTLKNCFTFLGFYAKLNEKMGGSYLWGDALDAWDVLGAWDVWTQGTLGTVTGLLLGALSLG